MLWCFLLLRPRRKLLYFAIPALTPYLLWLVVSQQLTARNEILLSDLDLYGYYLGYLISVAEIFEHIPVVLTQNLVLLADSIADLCSFYSIPNRRLSQEPIPTMFFAAAGIGLLIGGFYRTFKTRGLRPYLIFICFYLLTVLCWPFEPHRFLIILIPWLFVLIAECFRAALEKWNFLRNGIVATTLLYAGLGLWSNFEFYRQNVAQFGLYTRPLDLRESKEALIWMRDNLPKEAIVATTDPAFLYHQSGRKAVPVLNEGNLIKIHYPDRLAWNEIGEMREAYRQFVRDQKKSVWREWRTLGVTHIWVDDVMSHFPAAFALNIQTRIHRINLETLYTTPQSRVFRVIWNTKRAR